MPCKENSGSQLVANKPHRNWISIWLYMTIPSKVHTLPYLTLSYLALPNLMQFWLTPVGYLRAGGRGETPIFTFRMVNFDTPRVH